VLRENDDFILQSLFAYSVSKCYTTDMVIVLKVLQTKSIYSY